MQDTAKLRSVVWGCVLSLRSWVASVQRQASRSEKEAPLGNFKIRIWAEVEARWNNTGVCETGRNTKTEKHKPRWRGSFRPHTYSFWTRGHDLGFYFLDVSSVSGPVVVVLWKRLMQPGSSARAVSRLRGRGRILRQKTWRWEMWMRAERQESWKSSFSSCSSSCGQSDWGVLHYRHENQSAVKPWRVWSGYSLEDRLKYFRLGFSIKSLRMKSKPLAWLIHAIGSKEQTTEINFNLRISGGFNHEISNITLIYQYNLEAVVFLCLFFFFLKALKYLMIK